MRKIVRAFSIAALSTLALGASMASAQQQTFTVGTGSRIQFISEAPLENMTGVSSRVSGEIRLDPSDLSSAAGTVSVPIASLRTGIDLRDEHLRSPNWLDAAANPNATFEITRMEGASRLEPGQLTRVRIHGRFTIHGVTRDVVSNARIRLVPGEGLRGSASFRVRLTDHNISVPSLVRLKVANEIRVNVTIRATP